MGPRFLSIHVKTFLAFGTLITLALAAAGWGASHYFTAVGRRRIEVQQFRLAGLVASAMDDKIATYLECLKAGVREAPDRHPATDGSPPTWLRDRPAIRAMFENGIFLVAPDGRILASDTGTPLSASLQEALRPFFQDVANSRSAGVSEAYISDRSGAPAIMMAAPQIGRDGRVRLLLAGGIDLFHDDFLGALGRRRMPDASYLTLIDGQDRILIHPDPARILTWIGAFGPLDPHTGHEGSGERVNAAGIPTLTSVRHLKVVPWTLAANIPVAQATAPIRRFQRYLLAGMAVSLALTLALTWLLSYRLTENLEDFTRRIEHAADLPPGQRAIERTANDEVGVLVDAYNALVRRLDSKATRLMQAKARDDEELAMAKHVLQHLVEPGLKALPPQLHMETLQTQRINGDVCTYREGNMGLQFALVCDATGHGLTAGISTLPAIQAFLGMVARDIPLETVYQEINRRTHQLMPTGHFLCLLLLRMDARNGTLSVLNAGLPDAILGRPDGGRRSFSSRNLPAGIVPEAETPVIETVAVTPGDRLLAFTDGVLELFPPGEADRFLFRGLEACPLDVHVRAVQQTLGLVIGNQEQHDDATWALWEVPPPACRRPRQAAASPDPGVDLEEGMVVALTLCPHRQSVRDILPQVIRLLASQGLGARDEQTLTLTLTEALANAVDHGVLGLDSSLKLQGFETYEALRKLHLAALREGSVKLTLRLRTLPSGPLREVAVEVEDTGPGFDWRAWEQTSTEASLAPSGRGLVLIKAFSTDLSFNEAGNAIRFTLPCG